MNHKNDKKITSFEGGCPYTFVQGLENPPLRRFKAFKMSLFWLFWK